MPSDEARAIRQLKVIADVQQKFVCEAPAREVFDRILESLLDLAGSEYGFIGEVLLDEQGARFLKTHAITNIAWSDETQALYEENVERGLVFTNLATLFGRVIESGEALISNSPYTDSRRGGLPPGHPPLNAFLGVPLYAGEEFVGMAGVSNRAGGYDEELIEFIQPLLVTCGQLIKAYRTEGQRRDAMAALVEAKDAAEGANRAKSNFLTNMSHELRTPLTAILGFGSILQSAHPEDSEAVETIIRNGEHLLGLLDDMLDLAKVESGRMELDLAPTDLAQLLDDVVRLYSARASSVGLRLVAVVDGGLPALIHSDGLRIRQVLSNLIANAIKFTQQGVIEVRARRDGNQLAITVSDTGVGIEPKHLERIFDAFTQADSSTTRLYGGTGLGLSISRSLAELLGGELTVESEPGRGSRFTLWLPATEIRPIESVSAGSEDGAEAALPRGKRVLLAEDGADNRRLLTLLLKREGLDVITVEDGAQACDAVEQADAAGEPYDAILMDVQMPVLDGHEATRRLREAGQTLPIVAVTAHARNEDRDAAYAAGCDGFVTKPIDIDQLRSILREVLTR